MCGRLSQRLCGILSLRVDGGCCYRRVNRGDGEVPRVFHVSGWTWGGTRCPAVRWQDSAICRLPARPVVSALLISTAATPFGACLEGQASRPNASAYREPPQAGPRRDPPRAAAWRHIVLHDRLLHAGQDRARRAIPGRAPRRAPAVRLPGRRGPDHPGGRGLRAREPPAPDLAVAGRRYVGGGDLARPLRLPLRTSRSIGADRVLSVGQRLRPDPARAVLV